MGENLEHVKHDKAHDKHKDKKEAKKGGGLFGMLKKTPSKGKGDKAKQTETEVNNKDSPSRGDQQVVTHVSKRCAWFLSPVKLNSVDLQHRVAVRILHPILLLIHVYSILVYF